MKTRKIHLILIACFTLFSFGSTFAQETHTITLNVDEDGVFSFTAGDNTEVLDNSSLEAFSILVLEGDEIEWEGIAASGEIVDIEKIKFPRNAKPFKTKNIKGADKNGKKVAKGKVAKDKKNKNYKYIIDFTVGGKPFSIDPKIKVGS